MLFEAGVGETVRQELLKTTDLHTILRLQRGFSMQMGSGKRPLFRQQSCLKILGRKRSGFTITEPTFTTLEKAHALSDLKEFIELYNPKTPQAQRDLV